MLPLVAHLSRLWIRRFLSQVVSNLWLRVRWLTSRADLLIHWLQVDLDSLADCGEHIKTLSEFSSNSQTIFQLSPLGVTNWPAWTPAKKSPKIQNIPVKRLALSPLSRSPLSRSPGRSQRFERPHRLSQWPDRDQKARQIIIVCEEIYYFWWKLWRNCKTLKSVLIEWLGQRTASLYLGQCCIFARCVNTTKFFVWCSGECGKIAALSDWCDRSLGNRR